jgi:sigma-E factor negative regulatory protein RseA
MMKNKISAMMDGELFEDEANSAIGLLKVDVDARQDWEIYHLIGDVLRQPEFIHGELSSSVRELMLNEPAIFVLTRRGVTEKLRNITLSAAASLIAVGVVVWMSLQVSPQQQPQMAMQQSQLRKVSFPVKPKSNEYLLAHQEFSPSNDVLGGAAYIRNAAEDTAP